ncbi:COP9 signalosome complex subunit 5 [Homalodisca vitripennis]|nr:COP9 signalosome complex subunit 5 [Homalodisca vitripennis]
MYEERWKCFIKREEDSWVPQAAATNQPTRSPPEYQTIPLNKIEDFGVHCKQYYSLEVLLTNADYTTGQIFDLSDKLEQSEAALGRGGLIVGLGVHESSEKRTEDKLLKATKDSCKTTIEIIHGLMAQMIKDRCSTTSHLLLYCKREENMDV